MVKKFLQNSGNSSALILSITERDHLEVIGVDSEEVELRYDKINGIPCIVLYGSGNYKKMIENRE